MLEPEHDLCRDGDRIDALLRERRVAASSLDDDREGVGRGHERAGRDGGGAEVEHAQQVTADHRVDAVERARGNHVARSAGQLLLGVLEDEPHLAAQAVAHLHERARDGEQHGGVAVVAAGVHDALVLGRERDATLLDDRERVDVRAQSQDGTGPIGDEPRQHARGRRPRELEPAERRERLLDEAGRLVLLERQLRPAMEVPPPLAPRRRMRQQRGPGIDGRRGHRPVLWT